MPLKKEITLSSLVLYGVGIILGAGVYALIGTGAGVYALIGTGAGLAENMIWVAFLAAAFIAAFTGLSYSELSWMYPKEAAEYVYTKKAFQKESLSFFVGWTLVGAGIISAGVVALAFGGYLSYLIGGNATTYAIALIAVLSAINYVGIKESVFFNNFAAVIEAGGLVAVIILGFLFSGNIQTPDLLEIPSAGFAGIISAIGVIFFAFIGFEAIANVSEEVKNNKTIVPKAILISLAISTLLYVLLSIAVLKLATWQELSSSSAPLTTAVEKVIPNASFIISLIALFATSNTVLIILVASSRIFYGISNEGSLPKIYSVVGSRGTPYVSILFTGALAALTATYGDIKAVAQLTDLGIFIAYFFVNISLIKLRMDRKMGFPLFALLGALASLFMIWSFELNIWSAEIAIILAGMLLFYVYSKRRK